MDDERIVDLYWQRDTAAICVTEEKYGRYCYAIAYRILTQEEDAQESVNDTYLAAWNAMPPHRPSVLSTFLGKITRRISLNRWRDLTADKRGGGQLPLALEELGDVTSGQDVESAVRQRALARDISQFLRKLPQTERDVFICRYWYLASVRQISQQFAFSESKVKSMLLRTREKLRVRLIEEGYL